jgi:hypothetical protein
MKYIILLFSLFVSSLTLAQNVSDELERRNGFKEIKLNSDISSVKTEFFTETPNAKIYKYKGEATTVFDLKTLDIVIETPKTDTKIKTIRLILPRLADEDYFGLGKKLKETFGAASYSKLKTEVTEGIMVWASTSLFLEYIYNYKGDGIWVVLIQVGRLKDLPQDKRDLYTGNGF